MPATYGFPQNLGPAITHALTFLSLRVSYLCLIQVMFSVSALYQAGVRVCASCVRVDRSSYSTQAHVVFIFMYHACMVSQSFVACALLISVVFALLVAFTEKFSRE